MECRSVHVAVAAAGNFLIRLRRAETDAQRWPAKGGAMADCESLARFFGGRSPSPAHHAPSETRDRFTRWPEKVTAIRGVGVTVPAGHCSPLCHVSPLRSAPSCLSYPTTTIALLGVDAGMAANTDDLAVREASVLPIAYVAELKLLLRATHLAAVIGAG